MENETIRLQELVAQHKDIQIHKSFFGLIKQPVYAPTGSKLRFFDRFYSPTLRNEINNLFTLNEEALLQHLAKQQRLEEKVNGNLLLEIGLSADKQFAAIRLLQYGTLDYRPVMDVRFLTGDAAQAVAKII